MLPDDVWQHEVDVFYASSMLRMSVHGSQQLHYPSPEMAFERGTFKRTPVLDLGARPHIVLEAAAPGAFYLDEEHGVVPPAIFVRLSGERVLMYKLRHRSSTPQVLGEATSVSSLGVTQRSTAFMVRPEAVVDDGVRLNVEGLWALDDNDA